MKITLLIVMLLALIAGAVTKASVIVLTGVVIVMLALKIIDESSVKKKLASAKYLFVLLVCFFLIVPFAGGYYQNYKQYGTMNLSTWNRDARPYFFKTTPVYRPGLQNMLEGFCTSVILTCFASLTSIMSGTIIRCTAHPCGRNYMVAQCLCTLISGRPRGKRTTM